MKKRIKKKKAKQEREVVERFINTISQFMKNLKENPVGMRQKIIESDLPTETKLHGVLLTHVFEKKSS